MSARGVLMAASGNGAMGRQWRALSLPSSHAWSCIAYGGGLWVIVPGDSSTVSLASANNGSSWSTGTMVTSASGYRVAYGAGLFVAVRIGVSTASVYTSANGTTWTARTASAAIAAYDITYDDGYFVAAGNAVLRSADGITWATVASSTTLIGTTTRVAFGNGIWAYGNTNSGYMGRSTNDAASWTTNVSYASGYTGHGAFSFGSGNFVIPDYGASGAVYYSSTATQNSWNYVSVGLTPASSWRTIRHLSDGYFMLFDSSANSQFVWSADVVSWQTITMPASAQWTSAVSNGAGIAIAVCLGGTAAIST